jgi:RNA polymerase sigma-70 factor (ECF subfamily)
MEDADILAALRAGDEQAFTVLVKRHHASMVRIALLFVATRDVAEEVAQEAWLGVLQGLDRFEGRSSLKTWVFRILTNTAKTRGVREGRSMPFSSLGPPGDEVSVDADMFFGPDHERWPGHWSSLPGAWPEDRLLTQETRERLREAIDALPPNQRAVISLRDVEGWTSEEVCNALDLTETNQRVLLHRARARVRRALSEYLGEDPQ